MSKNQKTSLLLLAVVLTWGAIGFQIYSRYYPEIPELRKPTTQKFLQNLGPTIDKNYWNKNF